MNERTKTGLEIIAAAALIGLLGNVLLRQTPWGMNAFLFVSAFVAGLLMLIRKRRPEFLTTNTFALTGAMVFFASMFLIRDSIELRIYDTFAILVLMGVILLANFGVSANIAGVFHYAAGFIWSGLTSLFGPLFLLVSDIEWKVMPGNKISRTVFAVLRGFAVALPLLLIFGGLFMAADAVYEGLVNRVIEFDLSIVISHVVLTTLFAWLTAGYFRGATMPIFNEAPSPSGATKSEESGVTKDDPETSFVAKVAAEPFENPASLPDNATILEHINRSDPPNSAQSETKRKRDWQNLDSGSMVPAFTLGSIETIIILGLVDLLFLSFVIVQVPYLFGGMELVQSTPDFKLADYARRGFGELVAVAALVLPILLVSHWLVRRDTRLPERLFRILAGVQIALLFVIMASAVQRLVILTGESGYGLTTVRFYPMVFMTWLAVVFVWFALTVFRSKRNHFAWGALWAAVVILGATNLINPDAFIVRTNLDLMRQGREFDAGYNASLSHDAVPDLLQSISKLDAKNQCIVRLTLWGRLSSRNEQEVSDLRSWNLSRSRAAASLIENTRVLNYDNTSGPHTSECSESSTWRDEGTVP